MASSTAHNVGVTLSNDYFALGLTHLAVRRMQRSLITKKRKKAGTNPTTEECSSVYTIDVSSRSTAAARRVYDVLTDGASWPVWAPIDSFALEGDDGVGPRTASGAPRGPQGVGAVRMFRIGRYALHEQIVALSPDRRLDYVMLGGLLRDYRASVELTPDPSGGTHIRWQASFQPRVPGTGWLFHRVTRRYLGRMVHGLAAYAAAREADAPTTQAPDD